MSLVNPIEDAILYLLDCLEGKRLEQWEKWELSELKKLCAKYDFGADLYRGMIAHKNNWTHRGGRLDCNQLEMMLRNYYEANGCNCESFRNGRVSMDCPIHN